MRTSKSHYHKLKQRLPTTQRNVGDLIFYFVVVGVLFATAGCEPISLVGGSWHTKHRWNAEDFFDDPQLLELCAAIEADDADTARQLIDAGIDVNTIGNSGVTPLLWAFPGNINRCFSLLLDKGADPNVRITKRIGVGNPNVKDTTVTILAARSGSSSQFERVMSNGGNPHETQQYMKRTLLHVIIAHAFVPERNQKLALLLPYGPNLNYMSAMEETPMMAAVARGNLEAARMLIEAGADPNIFKPRSPEKLIHFLARESQLRDDAWKNATRTDFDAVVSILEQNGDSLEAAIKDTQRWTEIGRSYPPKEIRRLMDEEITRAKAGNSDP